jgi:hypothetical protein
MFWALSFVKLLLLSGSGFEHLVSLHDTELCGEFARSFDKVVSESGAGFYIVARSILGSLLL